MLRRIPLAQWARPLPAPLAGFLLAPLAGFLLAPLAGAANLQALELQQVGAQLDLVLRLDSEVTPKVLTLKDPDRLVIDLPNTAQPRKLNNRVPDSAREWVSNLRIGEHDKFLRLVLDLTGPLAYDLRQSARELQLVLQLPLITDEPALRPLVVVIDPGHGGKDPGASGPNGVYEKDVALSIARKLYRLLKPLDSFEPHLTRDDDTYLSLSARIDKAQTLQADLFLSVHADAAENLRARGASVYVLSLSGASSVAAKRLAQRENADPLQEHRIGGIPLAKDLDFNSTVVELAQTPTIGRSLQMAEKLLASIEQVSLMHGDAPGRANFAVLRAPYVPSILIETGYLSNRKDAASLTNSRFQRRMAKAILAGIYHYLRDNPHPGIAASEVKDFFRYRVQKRDTLSEVAQNYGITVRRLKVINTLKSNTIHPAQVLRIPVPRTGD